jgi:superfamily I DNA/RNA helicase
MPKIPIQVGAWDKKLNKSYRLSKKIALLVSEFQKKFFAQKYFIETKIESDAMLSLFDEPYIEYHYYHTLDNENEDKKIARYIYTQILNHQLNSNDVTILSSRIRMLRNLDYMLRIESRENTNTMFESREEFIKLFPDAKTGLERNSEIDKIRKSKKANFWMNRGTIKLSTIHSFKGWESPALFLVIEDNIKSNSILKRNSQPDEFSDELVYTGLTRCQNWLFIINIKNKSYHDYFKSSLLVDKKIIPND